MKMLLIIVILLLIIKSSISKTSLITYPIVNLIENSPINSEVVSLKSSIDINKRKYKLLNINEYERKKFEIKNEKIYIKNEIDREEFVDKKYCFDNSYCQIELHIIVNNGLEYIIIPIHIIDVNDNKPIFRKNEIEINLNENQLNGFKIPLEGAKDLDEGENQKINYKLICFLNCTNLFQLIIESQSFLSNYDQLSLKFNRIHSNFINENYFKLKILAFDKDQNENILFVNIKIKQKIFQINHLTFSLLNYEFIILLNSTFNNINNNTIGRVYAYSNNEFHRIHYELIINNKNSLNFIQINSLTGELTFLSNKFNLINQNQIDFQVQASILSSSSSSSSLITKKTNVRLLIRYLDKLNNLKYEFELNKSIKLNKKMNSSFYSFLILKSNEKDERKIQIKLNCLFYLNDEFLILIENSFELFSLKFISFNNYLLILKENFIHLLLSNFILNISIKHKLTQQILIPLQIQLIFIDSFSTTTTTTTTTSLTTLSTNRITTKEIIQNSTEMKISTLIEESFEFCKENQSFILKEINKNKNKENGILLKVNQINSTRKLINKNEILLIKINKENEIIINECNLLILNERFYLNKSIQYHLCYFNYQQICFQIKLNQNLFSKTNHFNLSFQTIQLILFFLILFITFIFILLICYLKQIHIFSFFSFSNNNSNSSSISQIKETNLNSNTILDNHLSSNEIKKVPYIFNIDDLIENEDEEEHLPTSNMFILPSIDKSSLSLSLSSLTLPYENKLPSITPLHQTQRTSSSSSFLQETKQLLDIISLRQQFHSSNFISEL